MSGSDPFGSADSESGSGRLGVLMGQVVSEGADGGREARPGRTLAEPQHRPPRGARGARAPGCQFLERCHYKDSRAVLLNRVQNRSSKQNLPTTRTGSDSGTRLHHLQPDLHRGSGSSEPPEFLKPAGKIQNKHESLIPEVLLSEVHGTGSGPFCAGPEPAEPVRSEAPLVFSYSKSSKNDFIFI